MICSRCCDQAWCPGFVIRITTCFRLWECGVVLAGVKAKPYGWPTASLDPAPGDTGKAAAGSRPGFKIKRSGDCLGGVFGVGWRDFRP